MGKLSPRCLNVSSSRTMQRLRHGWRRSMSTSAGIKGYPKWDGPSQCPSPVAPRPRVPPLLPPRSTSCPNVLPDRPDPPSPPQGFTRSRHIVPAAYPRSFGQSTGDLHRYSTPYTRSPLVADESSDQRKARNMDEARECVRRRFEAKPIEINKETDEPQLWLAGECWRRKPGTKRADGLTLVVSAANGFTKESWMPTIQRLLRLDCGNAGTFGDSSLPRVLPVGQVDEVWFLDDYHHGQSIDLNGGLIGSVHSWLDGGRDIANFVKHILPDSSGSGPETLVWRDANDSQRKQRKVVGVGHSVGGNAMVRAAHLEPNLFHALFLVEPMTPPIYSTPDELEADNWDQRFFRPLITMRRRTTWPSMTDALKVRSSPFFAKWHDETFRVWETHHLVPTTVEGEVTLATPSWAEAAVFSEPTGLAEGWDALPELRVPCGFLMAGDATATMGEEISREMVWRPPVTANERLMDAGHLIVHEKPDEVADALRRFLDTLTIEPAGVRAKL